MERERSQSESRSVRPAHEHRSDAESSGAEHLHDEHQHGDRVGDERPSARRPRDARSIARQRRLIKLGLWLLVPALMIWVAPLIVATTSLRQTLLDTAVRGKLKGKLTTSGASFGWLSPVRLHGVVVTDEDGHVVLDAERVSSERTLLGLILHRRDPGKFVIERPKLELIVGDKGSNLESLIAPIMEDDKPGSSQKTPVTIEVQAGSVALIDASTTRRWQIEPLAATVRTPASDDSPLEVAVQADIVGDDKSSGSLDAQLAFYSGDADAAHAGDHDSHDGHAHDAHDRDSTGDAPEAQRLFGADRAKNSGAGAGGSRGELQLKTKTLPLAAFAPVLRRFAGHSRIEGTLTTDARYGWQAAAQFQHQIDFKQFAAEGLSLAAAQWLGRDNLDVPLVEAHGSVHMQGDRVTVRDFALKSDVASVEADGSFKLSELTSTTGMLAALHDEDYSLRANVDLARLAKLAPATLRIRPGTELKAGRITADLESKATPDGHTWKSNIELGGLAAIIDGKPVEWQQPPLKLAVAAREGQGGLKIDQLICDSSFLRAEARGGLADGTLELDANLGQLAAELDRFIDLGDNRMGGQMQADFGWKRADDGRLVANGKLHLQNMEWLVGDSRPWREPKLEVTLSAAGKSDNLKLRDLVQASVRVEAGKDVLTLELTEPIRDIAKQTNWPLKGRLTGNLQRWLPRVQGFLPLAGWDLAGEVDVSGVATVSSDTIDIETASVNATDLQVAHEGLYINEPQIKSEFAAKLDRRTGRFQAPTATFASSTLAFRADDVKFESSDAGPQISANVGFRSDLARLGGWFQDPRANVDWQLTGLATGQVRLTHTGEQTTARWAVDVDNMSYSRAPDPRAQVTRTAATAPELELVWSEPKVRLSGQGIYESPRELVKLASCELEANSVKLAAAGTIEKPSSDCQVALQGEIAYDLQELSQRLRPQLGNMFDLRGRDTRPFALKGPVRNLEVQTGSTGNGRLVSGSTRAGSGGTLGGGFASTGPGGRGAGGSTVGGQGAAPSGAAWLRKELNANAGLAWVSANALGLPLGPGEIEAKLEQGVLQLKPVQVDVSEGHLRLTPRIHFDRPSPVMVADAGPVLEQVRISPEMCAMWLKYVLPILADVTEAEGKFSVQLSETANVPLDQPLDGEIRGQIDIHSVQVGPGPLAREMITLAQMIKALADNRPLPSESGQQPRMWVQLPQQPIPFHWKERRVYHDKLEINIQDVAIVTHGSVGADQTLDMVAMLPIRDEWVAKSRFLAALRGQQLQLPITGTLSAPRVDRRVFQQLTRQAVTNTAGKIFEQEVGRGLDKLFKPKQPAGAGAQGQAGPGAQPNAPAGGQLPFNPQSFIPPQFNPQPGNQQQ